MAPKAAPSGKQWIYIFNQTKAKDQQVGGQYAKVSCWLGIGFKNDSFQWFRVDSFFWETITLYTVRFQIENFAGCFHSLRAVLHTELKDIFTNP